VYRKELETLLMRGLVVRLSAS